MIKRPTTFHASIANSENRAHQSPPTIFGLQVWWFNTTSRSTPGTVTLTICLSFPASDEEFKMTIKSAGSLSTYPADRLCFPPMKLTSTPEAWVEEHRAFDSWPEDGSLPDGYFPTTAMEGAADFYREAGFVVLHEALSKDECQRLIAETARLVRNEDGGVEGIDPAPAQESDDSVLQKVLCIHFPHKLSPTFFKALSYPPITDLLTRVISPNVKAMQSMLFVKAAGKPGQAWHQDEVYIPTRDCSLTGAWIALDDATIDNGCLWVIPGSHRPHVLWPQQIHFDSRFDCAHESYQFPWTSQESVPVEVKAGSIVFFNGYLLHRSLPNRSQSGYRRSLVNHYMSAESLLPWRKPTEGGMAKADFRDIVLVAGQDPYAYKGTISVSKAFVRPSGEGGCADWAKEPSQSPTAPRPG